MLVYVSLCSSKLFVDSVSNISFAKVRSRHVAIRKLIDVMKQGIAYPEQQVLGISHLACYNDAQAQLV